MDKSKTFWYNIQNIYRRLEQSDRLISIQIPGFLGLITVESCWIGEKWELGGMLDF